MEEIEDTPKYIKLIKTAVQSVPNISTVNVVWNAVVASETKGLSWDFANNRFVVPATGIYSITNHVRVAANANATYSFTMNASFPFDTSASDCNVLKLNAGDVVKTTFVQNSGGSLNLNANDGAYLVIVQLALL